jgi:WD40 repeat protein
MWTRTRAVSIALLCLGGFVVCLIILTASWHIVVRPIAAPLFAQAVSPTPIAAIPVTRNINWMPHPQVRRISADGRWLYVKGSANGKNELIEWQTGRRIVVETDHREMCTFSPDAKFVAALQNQELHIWNLAKDTEQRTHCWDNNDRSSIHFSPDSRHIAVVSGQDQANMPFLQIWDAQTANLHASIWATDLFGHRGIPHVFNVAWGADHAFLADKSLIDVAKNSSHVEQVCCWDLQKAEVRFRIDNLVNGDWGHPTWQVSPDGKCCVAVVMEKPNEEVVQRHPFMDKRELLVPKKPMIQAWDIRAGKLLWQRSFTPERAFFHLSFTPDSKKVVISSSDPAKKFRTEAQLWNLVDGNKRTLVEAETQVPLTPFVLTASGRFLQYHDRPSFINTEWPTAEDGIRIVGGWWEVGDDITRPAITFDDNGSWHDRDGKPHVLFPSVERNKKEFERRVNLCTVGWQGGIEAPGVVASLSPDDRWLAIRVHRLGPTKVIQDARRIRREQASDLELRIVDLRDGTESPLLHDVEHWSFTPDGKHLITTGKNQIQVWSLPLMIMAGQQPPIEAKEPPPAPKLIPAAPPAKPVGPQAQPAERVADRMLWTCYLELSKPDVPRERIVKILNQSWSADKEVEIAEKMLLRMVKEDQAHAKKPFDSPIAELIFRLRDQTCSHVPNHPQPGEVYYELFQDGALPAGKLVAHGYDAIPDLIAAIEDDRFSRAVIVPSDGALEPYVLRIGDCALTIIECIAARSFRERNYLSLHRNGDPARAKKAVADWWKEFQDHGERQMLIQGVRKGDLNSAAQAKALVEKYPVEALPVIMEGIKDQLYQNERPKMFHAVTDRYAPDKTKSLPPEVSAFCRAFIDDDYGSRFGGNLKFHAPDVPGNLQLHALNVLGQHGDERATELLLADWERRRQEYGGGKFAINNEVIPAMLRCKDGAGLPSVQKGWAAYPSFIRSGIIYALREMHSEPGYAIATADYRRKLSELIVDLLSDQEEFKGARTWRRGKLISPYERMCDSAADIRIPGLENPPVFNPEAPRAERDKVIAQLKKHWLEYPRKRP